MPMEVEAKAHCDDIKALESTLVSLGARFLGEKVQKDTYFNHPARDFAQTDEALRVREVKKEAYITYKGPKVDQVTKTREEIKVKLDDPHLAFELLKRLGFKKVGVVAKLRRKYELGSLMICLDSIKGLGDFVEVEAEAEPSDTAEIERTKESVLSTIKSLGLTKLERKSYLELQIEKLGKSGTLAGKTGE